MTGVMALHRKFGRYWWPFRWPQRQACACTREGRLLRNRQVTVPMERSTDLESRRQLPK